MNNLTISIIGNKILLEIIKELKFFSNTNISFLDNISSLKSNEISEENMVETMVDTITENSEEEIDDVITDETEEYCNSECKCYLCETLNNIDERWISWKPKNPVEEILKN